MDIVLEGASYLIRLLDGKVEIQGAVEDLRTRGLLDHVLRNDTAVVEPRGEDANGIPIVDASFKGSALRSKNSKPARKLVAAEVQLRGNVKWRCVPSSSID